MYYHTYGQIDGNIILPIRVFDPVVCIHMRFAQLRAMKIIIKKQRR